ncbi:Ku protein [Tabrizicola sp. BL-A-41-H6]|uniref:non-homologous end joining protein Ku n=1 Tax=Tabrizicola sp. BL-A-41-H6 TaxID=3421107 RepID=UPI003D66C0E7
MASRASWKGTLKIAELLCPVALYTAASTSDRVAFHMVNRATGNKVRREFVDAETGDVVERQDQIKGYELGGGEHVLLTPDEIAAAVPESDKVLDVTSFVPCGQIDDVFFDKPYYLAPSDAAAADAFVLIRDGLRAQGVAAIARAVLFRRVRTMLIRAHGSGLIGTTLNFDHEVKAADEAFAEVVDVKITGEMLDLARHIIETKRGSFDPSTFDDRYDSALAELVKAKLEGRKIAKRPEPKRETKVNLLAALRESAKVAGKKNDQRTATPRRKAG